MESDSDVSREMCCNCGIRPRASAKQRWCQQCRRKYQRDWSASRTQLIKRLFEENAKLRAENAELKDWICK